jgi:hypothetical protein
VPKKDASINPDLAFRGQRPDSSPDRHATNHLRRNNTGFNLFAQLSLAKPMKDG